MGPVSEAGRWSGAPLPTGPQLLPQPPQPASRQGSSRTEPGPSCHSLEEVLLAVDTPGPGEAPVGQLHLAVCTLEAGAVPVSVQDLEDELVQDMLVAASTLGDLCGKRREKQHEPSVQPCSQCPGTVWMLFRSAHGGNGCNPYSCASCTLCQCRQGLKFNPYFAGQAVSSG